MADDELSRLRFLAVYHARRPHLERWLGQLLAYFEELRKTSYADPIHRIHSVRGRVKDGDSLWRKWKKKVVDASDERADALKVGDLTNGENIYDAMVARFSDIIGVRIVCNTLAGKGQVCARLEELGPFSQVRAPRNLFSKLVSADQYYKDSGYRSVHFDAKLERGNWPALALDDSDEDEALTVEIQVRTILEEAWGEIQHDLLYKPLRAGGQSEAMFLALSHRLHEADLNVQRLTRQLAPVPDERPRLKPSAQRSIPSNADALPLAYRESARRHLVDIERRRATRDYLAAIQAHDTYLAQIRDAPRVMHAVTRAERALDCLRLAERSMAKRSDATELLVTAEADYDHAVSELGDDCLLLWRRSRVRVLRGNPSGAISDLQRAIELSVTYESRYQTERFYPACLHRALTPLLWRRAQDLKASDPARASVLEDEAFGVAVRAVQIQSGFFNADDRSEACALHYCDVLNNAAWLAMIHKNDLVKAGAYIDVIERKIPPSLWEHDVYLLGTRLRLKVTRLQRALAARDGLGIGHIVEADALRTQLFQALDEEDEYVPEPVIQSMLSTVRSLDEVWQAFLGQSPG